MTRFTEAAEQTIDDTLDSAAYAASAVLDFIGAQRFTDADTLEEYWARRLQGSPSTPDIDRSMRVAKRYLETHYLPRIPEIQAQFFAPGFREGYREPWQILGEIFMKERLMRHERLATSETQADKTRASTMPIIIGGYNMETPLSPSWHTISQLLEQSQTAVMMGDLEGLSDAILVCAESFHDPQAVIKSRDGRIFNIDFQYRHNRTNGTQGAHADQMALAHFLKNQAPGII